MKLQHIPVTLRSFYTAPTLQVLRCALLLALAFFGVWSTPASCLASAQLPGFAEPYGSPVRVHQGIDVGCRAGVRLQAPCAGSISYVGLIPVGTGQRARAATITREDGTRVSVHPLEQVSVVKGARVEPGDVLGTVAQAGDNSAQETHVHLSLRNKDRYLDPSALVAGLFLAPAAHPSEPPAATAAPARAPVATGNVARPRTSRSRGASALSGALQRDFAPSAAAVEHAPLSQLAASAPAAQARPATSGQAVASAGALTSLKEAQLRVLDNPVRVGAHTLFHTTAPLQDAAAPGDLTWSMRLANAFTRAQWCAILGAVALVMSFAGFGMVTIAKRHLATLTTGLDERGKELQSQKM